MKVTVLDDRGRLFGRVNIVDAAILAIVVGLIPLAYAAYLLFRAPQPQLLSVDPASISDRGGSFNIRGAGFRPYLRVTLGTVPATYLFEAQDRAVVTVPATPAGSYDVTLYDASQEVGRLPGAVTVQGPGGEKPKGPRVEVFAVGAFDAADKNDAQALSQVLTSLMRKPMPWGQVLGAQQPTPAVYSALISQTVLVTSQAYQVRVVLRLWCTLLAPECAGSSGVLNLQQSLPLTLGDRSATFRLEEVHPLYTGSVEIVVNCEVTPELIGLLARKAGAGDFAALEFVRPSVLSVGPGRIDQNGAMRALIRVRVPTLNTPRALVHRNSALRVGEPFELETPRYRVAGRIVAVGLPEPLNGESRP